MRRPARSFRVAVAAALALSSAPLVSADAASAGGPIFERVPDAFEGVGLRGFSAFDLVASDFDLDGDADLLINWHHLDALELFENRGGRFVLRNPPGDPAGGLFENPGVAWLYGSRWYAPKRIAAGRSGLFLWHDRDRSGPWYLRWLDPAGRFPGWSATLETSLEFTSSGRRTRRVGRRQLEVTLAPMRRLRIETQAVASELRVRLHAGSGSPPPLWVGDPPQRVDGGKVALWLPDPHGMAWVDVEATAHPELVVVRGALGGQLRKPAPPKPTLFYRFTGDAAPRYELDASVVPPNRGRDRRAAWVDLEGDGRLELCVGRVGKRPRLLVRGAGGGLEDVAAGRGLEAPVDAFAWTDVDADGFDDLVWIGSSGLQFAANRGARGFAPPAPVPGAALPAAPAEGDPLHLPSLRVADFDADGRLDLWALARGPERTHHVFLRRGDHFEDASERLGLGRARGHRIVVLADWDADGFEDAVSFGIGMGSALLWHNQRGAGFHFEPLPEELFDEPIRAAVALDADGDGRTDLVAARLRRHLLRNVTDMPPGLGVRFRTSPAPVGARVRGVRPDGGGAVRRVGSAHASAYGQGSLPLLFPAADSLERIEVRFPGDAAVHRHTPPRDRRLLDLTR